MYQVGQIIEKFINHNEGALFRVWGIRCGIA